MIDAFEELGFERRPWLDLLEIKNRHHTLAGRLESNGDPLARINEARRILESHSQRLRHLLVITFPTFRPSKKATLNWELFSNVGSLSQRVFDLVKKRDTASTLLVGALVNKQLSETRKEIDVLEAQISHVARTIEERIQTADRNWPQVTPALLWQLAEEWTFCDRWNESLRHARTSIDEG